VGFDCICEKHGVCSTCICYRDLQAQAEHSILEEVSSLRDIFCVKKLSVRHVSMPHDDDGARIISELVEVVFVDDKL